MWFLELIVLSYFTYVVAYTLVFSLAGLFYRSPAANLQQLKHKFCILIPAYKEDEVILEAARKAIQQDYPASDYRVVVIADSLRPATLVSLHQLPIDVIEVHFENSTKVKALNEAFSKLPDIFDFAVILDGDNIMAADFLTKINSVISPVVRAVQGQRKPKNSNNTLALLDGISEAINNHVYRQGTVSLGLSAAINGSGVAFDYQVLKSKLSTMNSIGGFDRELEVLLVIEKMKVYYQKEAVVYDEKVSQTKSFQNQRKRWIYSQYFYLGKYFNKGMIALFKGNFTLFNTAVFRNIQLPRLINIGLLTFFTAAAIAAGRYLYYGSLPWIILFVLNTIAIFIAIPREFYTVKLLAAIAGLPMIFVRMFLILFKLKGANKKFIHTPHGVTDTKSKS